MWRRNVLLVAHQLKLQQLMQLCDSANSTASGQVDGKQLRALLSAPPPSSHTAVTPLHSLATSGSDSSAPNQALVSTPLSPSTAATQTTTDANQQKIAELETKLNQLQQQLVQKDKGGVDKDKDSITNTGHLSGRQVANTDTNSLTLPLPPEHTVSPYLPKQPPSRSQPTSSRSSAQHNIAGVAVQSKNDALTIIQFEMKRLETRLRAVDQENHILRLQVCRSVLTVYQY